MTQSSGNEAQASPFESEGATPAQVSAASQTNGQSPEAGKETKRSERATSNVSKGSALKSGKTRPSTHLDLPDLSAQAAAEIVARTATLGSRWNWLNWTWGALVTLLVPGMGAVIWWGVIPVGSPQGSIADKAMFVFIVHPIAAAFLSFLLCSMFLIGMDPNMPWRPLHVFLPTVSAVYITQVIYPGLQVLLDHPIEVMAVPALILTFVVTIIGIHRTPSAWLGCACSEERANLAVATRVFTKISIVFVIYTWVLALYTFASAQATGVGEGFLTVAINVMAFIFKKIMLAFTDPIGIDSAMLVSGFWIENVTDMFITLAFPSAESFGATFGVIFVTRMMENSAYLGFQLDVWFKFRVWIKGKFKADQAAGIEEDLEEYKDDRGHSAHHPGYRRRQLRFLSLKIFSQVSSYFYFMMVCPVLRYGPNKERFPYGEVLEDQEEIKSIYGDARLDPARGFLSDENFDAAMLFAFIQIVAVLLGAGFIWWWMQKYFPEILKQVRESYDHMAVNRVQYALMLGIMISNALIATSFIQVYYRVFFL